MADTAADKMTGDAHTSPRVQLNRGERHVAWLKLFAAGANYSQIARQYEVDPTSVREVILRSLKEVAAERRELAEHALDIHLERLESIYRAHYAAAVNVREDHAKAVKSADVVLRTLDRIAKLQGLDEPVRAEVTVRVRDDIDDELHRLANLIKDNTPDGAPTDVLDAIIEETAELPAADD